MPGAADAGVGAGSPADGVGDPEGLSEQAGRLAQLYFSDATVKSHVARILAKLGLRDRVQVVILAYETGMVRPGEPRKGTGPGPSTGYARKQQSAKR